MIFNSLGSNYTFQFALKALFFVGNEKDRGELIAHLERKYGGKAILLYKGREAIKLALAVLNLPQDSRVGMTGFTCHVVYRAIKESGLKPVYLDIDRSLNFSSDKIKDLKVLIIQNTLGNPCDIEKVTRVCKKKNIVLIEDLAHSIGTIYKNKKEAGTVGDFTTLSFSQDKIIDAVSGGALIIRNSKYFNFKIKRTQNLSLATRVKDRFYPFFTLMIRNLYPWGLGRAFHLILKKLDLLSKSVETGKEIAFQSMPNWYAKLANISFKNFESIFKHRRSVASVYARNLNQKILFNEYVDNINLFSCLRFPIFVKKRPELIKYLKKYGIFVSDVWYDAPIAPSKLLSKTDYEGECPFSEAISRKILNLPTHVNVSCKDAEFISGKINQWLNTR